MGRYVESLEILQKAWTEERFSYSGKYFNIKDVSVVPKPVQKPYPRIFQVGTSAKWFTMAAQKEWGIVVGGPAPSIAFKEAVNVYRDGLCHGRHHTQRGIHQGDLPARG